MQEVLKQPNEEELVDYFWRLTTELQAITDRLLLQQEQTARACFASEPLSDAYSLSGLNTQTH